MLYLCCGWGSRGSDLRFDSYSVVNDSYSVVLFIVFCVSTYSSSAIYWFRYPTPIFFPLINEFYINGTFDM